MHTQACYCPTMPVIKGCSILGDASLLETQRTQEQGTAKQISSSSLTLYSERKQKAAKPKPSSKKIQRQIPSFLTAVGPWVPLDIPWSELTLPFLE